MIISELENLKKKITCNKINLEDAKVLLFESKDKRTWHTKEWKQLRASKIKDSCEACKSIDTLTLQHTWHPKSYGDIKYMISCIYGEQLRREYPLMSLVKDIDIKKYIKKNYTTIERETCPLCGSLNVRRLKESEVKYKCNRCKRGFDTINKKVFPILRNNPNQKIDFKTDYNSIFNKEKEVLYTEKINKIKQDRFKHEIEKNTLLELIDQYIKYQNLEDTVTYCKKCAFMKDINHMDICPVCKKDYKKNRYKTCYKCKDINLED